MIKNKKMKMDEINKLKNKEFKSKIKNYKRKSQNYFKVIKTKSEK